MKTLTAATRVGISVVALCLALVGCGSSTTTETKTSTSTTITTTTSKAAPSTSAEASGPNYTIRDYIEENQILDVEVHRGDQGAPTINLPVPPGWSDAGPKTPEWAYGAIVYDTPEDPSDPPTVVAILSKLTGNVDPARILDAAPGELKNLPGYESLGDGKMTELSGFDAFQLGGNYMKDGRKRLIGQKTVVIPGQDGLYVLQLNADALEGQEVPLMDATSVIDEQTTITP
jgi:hypothetical protein